MMGDVREMDRTGKQDNNSRTGDSAGNYRRKAGQGMSHKRGVEERMYNAGRHERTYEERTEQVTRSGRIYSRMERDTGSEGLTLCDKVRQASVEIVKRMERQDTSFKDIKRIVREGLRSLSDTVEREMAGMSVRMAETVREKVEAEVAEIKDTMKGAEEMAKRKDELVMERMRRIEESLKESVDRETSARERLERIEDRIKDSDGGKGHGQDKMSDRMEKIEEKITETEDKLEDMRKVKNTNKDLEERIKLNEARLKSLRQAGERNRRKESMREMKDKIESTGKKLKYFGVDLGTGISERRELINRTIRCLQDSVAHKDKERFKAVIGRTRVSV